MAHTLPYSYFGTHHVFGLPYGFASTTPTSLAPGFPFPACALHTCPHSSVISRYRNFNLLSIGYVFRPRLRPRLTQGRSALPWKPWIFGRKDSHLSVLHRPVFLLNSCLGQFSAATSQWHSFSRSYGVILPSSLTMLLPPALGFSPHPPVSVYGTGTSNAIAAFLDTSSTCFATLVRSTSRP